MRKRLLVAFGALLMLASASAAPKANNESAKLNQQINQQLMARQKQFKGKVPELLTYINGKLPKQEAEAMKFLVAYMPLSDITMHSGKYVHAQVKSSLEARSFFSWGKTIPDNIFRHFVLPYRINNEYTDTARQVFFHELKNRIKGMNMHDAALEVNHWCHEKVTYRSTDERTSGPLTAVRTAFGRCGEESTFAVAALRAVGIPARQVYTPRWAHTDDNHAWVEVWIDGQWHFMGACEPESDLDLGWFAGPAKRAMMTHTVAFGKYKGPEEVLEADPLFTRINLLKNYTNTRKVDVLVVNAAGKPEKGAKVEFMVYNYAEFYPIATKYSSAQGTSSAITGYGDLIVWASKGGRYGFTKVKATSNGVQKVVIAEPNKSNRTELLELTPPIALSVPAANAEKAALNNKRLHIEDSIRNSYVATFIDSASVARLATSKGLAPADIHTFFIQSRGNWRELKQFVEGLNSNNLHAGIAILKSLSEKDFHDFTAAILNNHLANLSNVAPASDIVEKFVWGVRVGREWITPWRSFLKQQLPASLQQQIRSNPMAAAEWIKKEVALDTVSNYYNVPLSPEAVFNHRVADRYSRNLLFVTICRTLDIPARFEPTTRTPQYYSNGAWVDVQFEASRPATTARGTLTLTNPSKDKSFTPQYYPNYTIAKLENGQFTTLDYEGSSEVASFPATLSLEPGFYRVMTGNRANDGSVFCNIRYFNITANSKEECPIEIRPIVLGDQVLGKANMEATFSTLTKPSSNHKLADFQSDKGVVVAVIDPDKEPTKHLIEDMKAVKDRLDKWGGTIILTVRSGRLIPGFNPANYLGLPKNVVWGYDASGDVGNAIDLMCGNNGGAQAPQVSVINAKGEIVYYSEGYSIALGETILKNVTR